MVSRFWLDSDSGKLNSGKAFLKSGKVEKRRMNTR